MFFSSRNIQYQGQYPSVLSPMINKMRRQYLAPIDRKDSDYGTMLFPNALNADIAIVVVLNGHF
jgi:hypothetical protein